jgi:hypothetical protein
MPARLQLTPRNVFAIEPLFALRHKPESARAPSWRCLPLLPERFARAVYSRIRIKEIEVCDATNSFCTTELIE